MSTTITLTRAERDVVLDLLWRWTYAGGDPLPFDTREEATSSLVGLQRAFRLRDELRGWHGEDAAESTGITVSPELIELLKVNEQEYAESLQYEREHVEVAKAGDRDWWPCGCDDYDEMVRSYENQLRRDENTIGRCRDILARLDSGR